MIIQDEYGYKIKNWNKYQNLQEREIQKDKEPITNNEKVKVEIEKELKKEIETGGDENANTDSRKIEDFI